MGWPRRPKPRILTPQRHDTGRLVRLIVGTVAGLGVVLLIAYVVARLSDFDNQGP